MITITPLLVAGLVIFFGIAAIFLVVAEKSEDPNWYFSGYTKISGIVSSSYDDKMFIVIPKLDPPNHIVELNIPSGFKYFYPYGRSIELFQDNKTGEYKLKHPYEDKLISTKMVNS